MWIVLNITTMFLQAVGFIYMLAVCAIVVHFMLNSSIVVYLLSIYLIRKCYCLLRCYLSRSMKVSGQGILVTGCDTGFGHDLSLRLDALGFTVFAGCLHPSGDGAKKLKAIASNRLHIVGLDVGNDTSVQEAHDYVLENLPDTGMWGIVSNAGFNVMGDVELCTVKLYQKAMNVNLYGAVRTIRQFLYLVRKSKGRVAIVTSVKGLFPCPADSAYHVTKHGLETLADSLRLEMIKFGVKVSIIEPGNFGLATACQSEANFKRYRAEADEMWASASNDVKESYGREYLDAMLMSQEKTVNAKGIYRSASTTHDCTEALVEALTNDDPQTRYLVDGGASFINPGATFGRYYSFIPTWLSDWIIVKWTKCDRLPMSSKQKSS